MPAGDLIVLDYQWELRGLLGGASTRFDNGPTGWGGFAIPGVKTNDVVLDQADGTHQGRDYLTDRVLTFPISIGGHGPEDAMLDLLQLVEAWTPSTVDVDLAFRLPGWGLCRVTGRPRGVQENLARLKSGEVDALATFVAGDPSITFLGGAGSGS